MAGDVRLTLPDGSEHALVRSSLTIGRDSENDLPLESSTVSREHAALVLREGRWFVEDLGSTNGTFLNGTRVAPGTPLPLRHGDRIEIGEVSVVFSWPIQLADRDATAGLRGASGPEDGTRLSPLQTRVLQCLCEPWLAGAGLASLPSNDQIAAMLGTPGAAGTVKDALRRIYAKAGLSGQPAQSKRRAVCHIARQRGWLEGPPQ